jgi:hypothetical protein
MNEIKLIVGKKKVLLKTASCWNELTEKQYLEVIKIFPGISSPFPDSLLVMMLDVHPEIFKQLSPVQKHYLEKTFDFLKDKPDLSTLMIESFKINKIEYIGFQHTFSNTTWEEFTFADQYFLLGKYHHAIAVLYREKRENYNFQSDIRVPFSVYGMPKRIEAFQTLNPLVIAGIVLNYAALRDKYLINKYKYIFEGTQTSGNKNSSFSWIDLHRNILSENFFEEKKLLKSTLHIVLHRLNSVIEESRKRKRK